jgi:hypothetical protein
MRHVLGKLGIVDNEKPGLTTNLLKRELSLLDCRKRVVRPVVEEAGCQAHRHSLQVRYFLCRRSRLSGP